MSGEQGGNMEKETTTSAAGGKYKDVGSKANIVYAKEPVYSEENTGNTTRGSRSFLLAGTSC